MKIDQKFLKFRKFETWFERRRIFDQTFAKLLEFQKLAKSSPFMNYEGESWHRVCQITLGTSNHIANKLICIVSVLWHHMRQQVICHRLDKAIKRTEQQEKTLICLAHKRHYFCNLFLL